MQLKYMASLREKGTGREFGHFPEGQPQTESEVRHYVVTSRNAPVSPHAGRSPSRDVQKFHSDVLIESWCGKRDERQESRHLVGKACSPGMQQRLDGPTVLPLTRTRDVC